VRLVTTDAGARRALAAFVGGFVDALFRSGVQHFCVCPGSRSTPLALAISRQPGARLWMHLDERSAAFFALGLAKSRREPVALVCTSGTAAANFLPAIVEAFHARVPLIVLTADRPHELRDFGAPQTIDQVRLYGSHVRWFVDLPEPDDSPELIRYVRVVASRATATATGQPAGPVHLNCPFREPLIPAPLGLPSGEPAASSRQPAAVVTPGRRALAEDEIATIADQLASSDRGLIVCGPQDDPTLPGAVTRLATHLGFPILADPLSGLRCGPHDRSQVLDRYDAFLGNATVINQFVPDVVLRFGGVPTSKSLALYLERHDRQHMQLVVDGHGGWSEPSLRAAQIVHADGRLLCQSLVSHLESVRRQGDSPPRQWARVWRQTNDLARSVIRTRLAEMDELFEGRVFSELAELLPEGATLYAGNSMPVRDLDAFFPTRGRAIRFLANRGVNGIDGVISSALGASATSDRPVVLVIGDLSFYHDANGLLAARQHGLKLTIVLLNNNGGGIFSFLPQATDVEEFEPLFGTPHRLDFRPLSEAYGARFRRVATWDDFRETTACGISGEGLTVVEVPTERARNVVLHRQIVQEVSVALAQSLDGT
jgi:2-succinyl-5-enolpyruvyl-6-hydroxy-3-cyclohexene-1-carboxylate synthase